MCAKQEINSGWYVFHLVTRWDDIEMEIKTAKSSCCVDNKTKAYYNM